MFDPVAGALPNKCSDGTIYENKAVSDRFLPKRTVFEKLSDTVRVLISTRVVYEKRAAHGKIGSCMENRVVYEKIGSCMKDRVVFEKIGSCMTKSGRV